jgi:hypothetical protein
VSAYVVIVVVVCWSVLPFSFFEIDSKRDLGGLAVWIFWGGLEFGILEFVFFGGGVSKIGAQFGGRVLSPGFHCHFHVGGKFSTSL